MTDKVLAVLILALLAGCHGAHMDGSILGGALGGGAGAYLGGPLGGALGGGIGAAVGKGHGGEGRRHRHYDEDD